MNGCSGDCQLNNPMRCPCPDRCDSVTKIMQAQTRFLSHWKKYVRPEPTRAGRLNFPECITLGSAYNDRRYNYFDESEAGDYSAHIIVVDGQTGFKVWANFSSVARVSDIGLENAKTVIRDMIESYFSRPAYEVVSGVWVA
jgi:hypothetical protein